MKTITMNLYSFSELSPDGKQAAIERCREGNQVCTDYIFSEARASLEAFSRVFDIKIDSEKIKTFTKGLTLAELYNLKKIAQSESNTLKKEKANIGFI